MESAPIWFDWATFDEWGHVNGIRDDAPTEAKDAYEAYQNEIRDYVERGEPIPR